MLSILIFAGLACGLVSDTQQKIENAQATVQHVATQVQEGREVVATVEGSKLVATLRSVATDVDESGYLKTAQVLATEHGPSMIATAKAFATQEGPDLIKTAKAYATQFASSSGETPTDIPLLNGDRQDFYANKYFVSYETATPFQAVLTYYQEQMPQKGWVRTDDGSQVSSKMAVLTYAKADRKATVSLSVNPLSDTTIVLITIK